MSSQNQEWRPVHYFQGLYEVSDHGTVRSLNRAIRLPDGRIRNIKGKVLSHKRNNVGYLFVSLSKDGVTKTKYIHRLVAEAFIPNPGDLPEVNHISGNKKCNTPDQLEWVSHRENVQHAYDNGLSSNMGCSHYFAAAVIDNTLGREFGTVREWCDARGISYSTGRNVLNGQKSSVIDLTNVVKIIKINE